METEAGGRVEENHDGNPRQNRVALLVAFRRARAPLAVVFRRCHATCTRTARCQGEKKRRAGERAVSHEDGCHWRSPQLGCLLGAALPAFGYVRGGR